MSITIERLVYELAKFTGMHVAAFSIPDKFLIEFAMVNGACPVAQLVLEKLDGYARFSEMNCYAGLAGCLRSFLTNGAFPIFPTPVAQQEPMFIGEDFNWMLYAGSLPG